MKFMGKKQVVSIVDESLVLHQTLSKQKTIANAVTGTGSSANELFAPVGAMPEHVEKSLKKTTKLRARITRSSLTIGLLSTVPCVIGIGASIPELLFLGVPLFAASMSVAINFDNFNKIEKAAKDQVFYHNYNLLISWVKERYGVDVVLNSGSGYISLSHGATFGLNGKVWFTGTDNNSYLMKTSDEGKLFVELIPKKVLPAASEIAALEAPKVSPALTLIQQSDPIVSALLDDIRHDVKVLESHDVDVEQQHILDRAVQEADRAVSVLLKIRTLDAEASNIETVDILSLVKAEISEVKKSVLDNLHAELKTVNSYRIPSIAS